MKGTKKIKKLAIGSLIALVSGTLLLPAFTKQEKISAADDVVLVSPTAPAIEAVNELSLAKDIDSKLQPKITSTANFTNTAVSVEDGPKVTLHGNYNWSHLVFNELKNTDTVTVSYPYVGTYKDKPISLNWTFSEFYKAGNTYHNATHPKSPKTELFINQSMYNGYVYRGIESFKLKYDFRYADGTVVEFDNNAFLGFNSLNGYNDEKKFDGEKYKDDPYFANYKNVTEGVSYLNKDASSKIYLMDNTNIKSYQVGETSPNNPATGTIFAGSNNLFEDAIGAKTFTKNSVSYQIKGKDQNFLIVGSRGSAWNTPSGATLFNVLPKKPAKKVSDTDEKLVIKDTLNDLEDGIKNGVTYTITQKVGVLGNDMLTQYSEFGFKDVLNDVYDAKNAVTTVKDSHGNDVTSKFDIKIDGQTITANAKAELLSDVSIYDGRTYTMSINVKIDEAKAPSITTTVMDIPNTATVSVNNTPQVTNKVDTLIQRKPLDIQKAVNKEVAKVGEEITYTVTVNNPESITQSAEVSDDINNVLKYSNYTVESITIDGVKQTDAKDQDDAEILNNKISARIKVKAHDKSVITFKVKATKPTGDDAMKNIAILKTPDGEKPSNEVKTVVPPVSPKLPATNGNKTDKNETLVLLIAVISAMSCVLLVKRNRK